jgi:hypothetical protein
VRPAEEICYRYGDDINTNQTFFFVKHQQTQEISLICIWTNPWRKPEEEDYYGPVINFFSKDQFKNVKW